MKKKEYVELINKVKSVRYNLEAKKIEVVYASGTTRNFTKEPNWINDFCEEAYNIINENGETVYSHDIDYLINTYSTETVAESMFSQEAPAAEETQEEVQETTEAEATSYTAATVKEAWSIANKLFKTDYEYNTAYSKNAGYDVYMSTLPNSNDHISDLSNRLEVNVGCKSINIWIEPEQTPAPEQKQQKTFNKYSSFKGLNICMQHFASAVQQEYTSAETSINSSKIPSIFSKLVDKSNKLNLELDHTTIFDNGCGKYTEHIKQFCKKAGADYIGQDKYNQSDDNNNTFKTVATAATENSRIFTSSNVLNVIKGEQFRFDYIADIKQYMKAGERLYITVYEGNKSSIGKKTSKDCWQENRKLASYIPELEKSGFSVLKKYGMLICTLCY